MNFNSFSNLLKYIGTITPLIFALFTTFSLLYNYSSSDPLTKKIFSSKSENAISKISSFLIRILMSFTLSFFFYAYMLKENNLPFIKLWPHLLKEQKIAIYYLSTLITFTIIFYFLIFFIKDTFNTFLPSKPGIKSSQFYVLAQDLRLPNVSRNTKIFIISKIDNDTLLLGYLINNQPVRLLYPVQELNKLSIRYNTPLSLKEMTIELNEQIAKNGIRSVSKLLIFYGFVLIPFGLSALFTKNPSLFFTTFTTMGICLLIIFFPSISRSVKNVWKKYKQKNHSQE